MKLKQVDKVSLRKGLKKVYEQTFDKGAHADDSLNECMRLLNLISHKPTEEESEDVNGDVGDKSYYSIYDKRFKIVLYIEE